MHIKDYLHHYNELTKGIYTQNTYDIHVYFSHEFIKVCDALSLTSFKRLDLQDGLKIINHFKTSSKKSNDTINKIMRFIKTVMKHYDIYTTFLKLPILKIKTQHFQRFYHEELKTIVRYVLSNNTNANAINYQAAILLLIDSGLRLTELLSIKKSNIDFHSDPMRIYIENTKNKKPRYAPFSEFSAPYVKILMDAHKQPMLFWNFKYDVPFSRYCMRSYYRIMKEKLHIDRIHTHRFRKSFASILAENGMSIFDLQILLDHTRVSTTQLYTQTKQDRVLKSYTTYRDWKLN